METMEISSNPFLSATHSVNGLPVKDLELQEYESKRFISGLILFKPVPSEFEYFRRKKLDQPYFIKATWDWNGKNRKSYLSPGEDLSLP